MFSGYVDWLSAAHAPDQLRLPPQREFAVAAKGGQHALVAEILAPRLERLGGQAASLSFSGQRLAEAVRPAGREVGPLKASRNTFRIGVALLQCSRLRPIGTNLRSVSSDLPPREGPSPTLPLGLLLGLACAS